MNDAAKLGLAKLLLTGAGFASLLALVFWGKLEAQVYVDLLAAAGFGVAGHAAKGGSNG